MCIEYLCISYHSSYKLQKPAFLLNKVCLYMLLTNYLCANFISDCLLTMNVLNVSLLIRYMLRKELICMLYVIKKNLACYRIYNSKIIYSIEYFAIKVHVWSHMHMGYHKFRLRPINILATSFGVHEYVCYIKFMAWLHMCLYILTT